MIIMQLFTYVLREGGERLVTDIIEVSGRSDASDTHRKAALLIQHSVECGGLGADGVTMTILVLDCEPKVTSFGRLTAGRPRASYEVAVVMGTPPRCRKPRPCVEVTGDMIDVADFVQTGLALDTKDIDFVQDEDGRWVVRTTPNPEVTHEHHAV